MAGDTHTGTLNATVTLVVQNGSAYILEDSVTLPITSIVHSPLVREITDVVIIGASAVILVAIAVYFARRKK